ncbi:WD domain, G-beta repeat [Roseimaritima multifibrata]|uniref:WD domain, G-beta repeat n=1 Tax=Roseimaritima multifibrata TaxID=1930274 RepID=A0A517MBT4_9BACT|nr:WD40 repeat domain-containing protein [Roseimaritima multifibrata]QDS92359.1 WD domain, G-beta repeat [Roseimaritima multifibrata]
MKIDWFRWGSVLLIAFASNLLVAQPHANGQSTSHRVAAVIPDLANVSEVLSLEPQDGSQASPVITALAVDPAGQVLIAAGDDHHLRVIDPHPFEEAQVLRKHTDWVRSLDFRNDGKLLVSAGNDGQIILWDREQDWKVLQTLEGAPAIASVCFAPQQGMLAAVGFDPQLFLLQQGGARRPVLRCGCNDLRVVRFSDDMRLVVAAGRSGNAHFFDPVSGQPAGEFELHSDRIRDLVFMPGSNVMVSVGEDRRIVVYDSLQGEILHTIPVLECKLFCVTPLDANHVAVGGADNKIRIVDIQRGQVKRSLSGHSGSIASVEASAEYLFSGSFDATVRRWPIAQILQAPLVAQRDDQSIQNEVSASKDPTPKR